MERLRRKHNNAEQLARGLGWFSLALGVMEMSAPRRVARQIGVRDDASTESVVRMLGAREIANGVAILAQPDQATWIWARVGGDAINLSMLRRAMASDGADRRRALIATAGVLGVTMLDVVCARRLTRTDTAQRLKGYRRLRVWQSTTINLPIDQVYEFWRNLENLPRFVRHLESVQRLDDRRSHWRATGPGGISVEWDSEILEELQEERIVWRSVEGSVVQTGGTVRFGRAPGARGTEIHVRLHYTPPAGVIGQGIAWLFSEALEEEIHEDLHRCKQLLETGEIPLTEGPGLRRPAQPAAQPEEIKALAGVRS